MNRIVRLGTTAGRFRGLGPLLSWRWHSTHPAPTQSDEYKHLHNLYLTTLADTENLRKQTVKEIDNASRYSITAFSKDMLGIVDTLETALRSVKQESLAQNKDLDNLYKGVDLTVREITTIFKRHGIESFESLNAKFDPKLHCAVFEMESEPAGNEPVVVSVQKKGYKINDRLLRPSLVGISK